MNLLVIGFAFLSVFMTVLGLFMHCGNLLPENILQLLRYGRANIANVKPFYVQFIEVPKKWFAHFYLFAVTMQLTVCISVFGIYFFDAHFCECLKAMLDYVAGERSMTVNATTTVVATSIFFFHLSRRLYETLCVSVYSNTKMNITHYLLGYIHYAGASLCLIAHSPMVTSNKVSEIKSSSFGIMEATAVAVFFLGNYVQHRAHVGLANLRKGSKDKEEATGHKIPRGELFELISCPNYFGEILIYCSMMFLFDLGNASWNVCTFWVISNQIVSAIMNHKWYISTFKSYPKERKAIFPYIL